MHISLGEAIEEENEEDIAVGRDFAVGAVLKGFCAVAIQRRYMGSAGHGGKEVPAFLTVAWC